LTRWREVASGEPPPEDYLFGAILVPIVERLLTRVGEPTASTSLKEVFDLLEELLHDTNSTVRDVVDVSFSETLAAKPSVVHQAMLLAGPALRASLAKLAR
jgi:hypothetical protein